MDGRDLGIILILGLGLADIFLINYKFWYTVFSENLSTENVIEVPYELPKEKTSLLMYDFNFQRGFYKKIDCLPDDKKMILYDLIHYRDSFWIKEISKWPLESFFRNTTSGFDPNSIAYYSSLKYKSYQHLMEAILETDVYYQSWFGTITWLYPQYLHYIII